ncbi:hypothetical protein ACIP01_22050 [Pseudomonas monteilii]|uniref:hypothetical protein n=1 Tax=Pseudomonas monteilii TaxID=76759 RepID=UPI00382BA29F
MDIRALVRTVRFWFITALIFKAIFAVLSLYVGTLLFGLALPIAVMAGYWWVGNRVRDNYDTNLTVAKFADSIYYLGFLFTVVSIIICLIDIQSIGENLTDMAMRFGAALVSTGIGMVARTLYVGFRPDQDDAAQSVHDQAVKASENLAHVFEHTHQHFLMFRDSVISASKDAVSSVQEQITEMSKRNIAEMDSYFAQATERSNEALATMLTDVKKASDEMLGTISGLAQKSEQTLERMESHSMEFGAKASARLEQTLFPDDIFAKKLSPALDTLETATEGVSSSVTTLAGDVKDAARSVGTAIRGLNTKTQALEENLAAIGGIVDSQQRLMDSITSQGGLVLERFERVQKEFLDTLDDYQQDHQDSAKANQEVISKLTERFGEINEGLVTAMGRLDTEIGKGMKGVIDQGAKANEALAFSMMDSLKPLIQAIVDSNKAHGEVSAKVEHSGRRLDQAYAQLNESIAKIESIQPAIGPVSVIASPEEPAAGEPPSQVAEARPA